MFLLLLSMFLATGLRSRVRAPGRVVCGSSRMAPRAASAAGSRCARSCAVCVHLVEQVAEEILKVRFRAAGGK